MKVELCLETHGTQHAHRIFPEPRLGSADRLQGARGNILRPADVIPQREIRDVVVERVGGEITPPNVLTDGAVYVVAYDASGLIQKPHRMRLVVTLHELGLERLIDLRRLAVLGVGVRHRLLTLRRCTRGSERCDLDRLATEKHMGKTEAAADEAAVAEQFLDLLRQRIGCYIEVLGHDAKQQIAYAPPDQEGLKAPVAQAVEHAQRVGRDARARYGMLRSWNDPGLDSRRRRGRSRRVQCDFCSA